jgi:hypothetical protein
MSTPSPSASITVTPDPGARAPAPDAFQTAGAIVAIVLALGAGIVGYRIIRGGRGL